MKHLANNLIRILVDPKNTQTGRFIKNKDLYGVCKDLMQY